MSLLDSFTFAYSEEIAGPDPSRLPGLIELARLDFGGGGRGNSLSVHLAKMLERVKSARESRQGDFSTCRDRYGEELVELIELNLEAYLGVESCLQALLQAVEAGQDGPISTAVDRLEASAEKLQASTEELTDLHACGALICPHCGMPGKELQCATCGIECFYPDPDGQPGPSGKFQLPPSYWAVFEAYTKVLAGEAILEELFDVLTPLEKALLHAEDMVEQIVADQPDDLRASTIEDVLDECLEGIAQMRAVEESRQLRDLHEGWTALVTNSAELYRLLPNLAQGTLA